ncbi:type VI secretion system tip protein TssI/VgrG [Pseudomonas knackmussii]|uniref:type VI secretion system Vgr family protein n=1 Tax=Pseudomonas knackmussii TaxID=65741 RepID=UPI003BD33FF0
MFHPANQPHFSLAIEGLEHDLQVLAFEGREALNEPYRFVIDLVSEDDRLDIDALLHKLAFLQLSPDGDGIHGQLMKVALINSGRRRTHYKVALVPRLAYLDLRHNTRIFQRLTVQQIIERVLKEHGILANAFKFQFSPTVYAPREYCTQYNESDLHFINRLCEEEGFHYHWRHSPDGHLLVFGDDQSVFLKLRELGYQPDSGMVAEEPVAKSFGMCVEARTSRVSRRDYRFETPFLQLEADAIQQPAPVEPDLEDYAYPGGFSDRRDGQRLSQRALERHRANHRLATGSSDQPGLRSGYLLPLCDHPRAAWNDLWLLTEVVHEGRQPQVLEEDIDSYAPADGFRQGYRNTFSASFWNVPYRPPLKHGKPRLSTQTAFVTGPAGEEIHCDEHGRVKVQFRWDRDGKGDDTSSCWLRVAQASAGNRYGAMAIPRVGMEVRVEFLDDDIDKPMVSGCLYHGENQPPYPMPANKTRTLFKTLSSPGGNGSNELRIEDKAGQEQIHVHAQRDLEFLVGNDESRQVGNDLRLQITHDVTLQVGNDKHLQVEGQRSETIKGNSVHAFEAEEHRSVKGARKTKLDADDHLSVAGNSHTRIGQALSVEAGQDVHLKAGANLVLAAGASLCLVAGGQHILISASGIFSSVPIQPGGAPIPGAPAKPLLPDGFGMPGAPGSSHAGMALTPVPRSHRARYRLLDRETNEPLAGVAYTLRRADGGEQVGYTDQQGMTFQAFSDAPAEVELLIAQRTQEEAEPLFLAGQTTAENLTLDYTSTNSEDH